MSCIRGMGKWSGIWPCLLVLVAHLTSQPCAAVDRGASIVLRARWQASPYIMEAAEMVAEEQPQNFWAFVEAAYSSVQPDDVSKCWAHIMNLTMPHIALGSEKVAALVLASRKHSAKVAMYQQLTKQLHPDMRACCFVDVGGQTAKSVEELSAALKQVAGSNSEKHSSNASTATIEGDHIYPSPSGVPHAVLYSPIGAACTAPFHNALKAAAENGSVVYVFRPVLHDSCQASEGTCMRVGSEEPLLLPGWGVEAVLKNTEYSAMDEKERKASQAAASQVTGSTSSKGAGHQQLGTVKGFDFDTLVARKPALSQELLTFRDHMLSSDEEDSVKVWEVKDVGLQAAQRIMQAAEPLSLFMELSQNFPSLVSSLSRQEVNSSMREAVAHNQQYVSAGGNYMLLNGLTVDINDFDYFGFLDRVQSELRLMQQLSQLGLSQQDVQQLLQLRTEDKMDTLEDARLDMGLSTENKDKVFWLNDLEGDRVYRDRGYGTSLQDILNVYPGRLKPMALNLFNLALVLDPVSGAALTWANFVERMWTDMYPIRLGIIPKVPAVLERMKQARANPFAQVDTPAWDSMGVSEKFGLAFVTLDKAWGSKYPMIFWLTVASYVQREHSWGNVDETLRQCFEVTWSRAVKEKSRNGGKAHKAMKKDVNQAWKDVTTGTDWSAEAGKRLHGINVMLEAKGVANEKGAVGWLNGMQIVFTATSDQQVLQQELLYKVMMEQQRLQEAVYFGRLDEGADVQASMLEGNSLIRWNPWLMARDGLQYAPMSKLIEDADYQSSVPQFAGPLASKGKNLNTQSQVHPASHLMVVNLDSRAGRQLAAEAIRFLVDSRPGSDNARIQLLLNPAHASDALNSAPPTLLEAAVHLALNQLPQISGSAPKAAVSSIQAVVSFLHAVLGDAALATRLSGPFQKGSSTEVEVLLALAKKAGIQADAIKRGLLTMLDVEPNAATGSLNFKPPASLVQLRTSHARLARDVLHLPAGSSAVISNGHVKLRYDTPSTATDDEDSTQDVDFVAEDLSLLTSLVASYQPGAVMAAQIQQAYEQGRLHIPESAKPSSGKKGSSNEDAMSRLNDVLVAAAAAISTFSKSDNLHTSKQLAQVMPLMAGRMVEVPPPAGLESTGLHIVCILNPLTRPAQRISQVLTLLRHSEVAPSISLLLNPAMELSDLPLKSFYRYALPNLAPGAGARDVAPGPPAAHFARLPSKRVLTLNVDVPEAWLVEAVQAQHDLDNLRLADIPEPTAYAELELSALMLTGSCIDVTAGRVTPSRGVQLHLGTAEQPHHIDTLVMSNLAYFQLKAAPGSWQLSLAPGRTHELYEMKASGAATAHTMHLSGALQDAVDEARTHVLVSSLAGKRIVLQVKKRPGKEQEDVLKQAGEKGSADADPYAYPYGAVDEEEEDDVYDATSSTQSLPGGSTINIFTVASGHMYERLQKIMMLSVLKHTKSKVKFWFISNYMSPHHKQVIPIMAKKYGFDYAFVTYKWPHWLHKQTDKQRTIWAYKILFLDVLFPLDVERIIFVDSDQVVRTDLAELYHMDIKGKPYAYTPFCDNNKDMDEFRFWKGGFWHGHLQGKPYHISALYLVDLKKFRAMAAGDQLRVVYEQLSKDPNSLANLDQDLPNYTQHQIPIFSLPQEWLWCESWCGNSTKQRAKTIDLCNNPRTKEPKLSAARRIISEWPEYDRIQADITAEIDAELGFGTITSAQDPGPAISSASTGQQLLGSTTAADAAAEARWQTGSEDSRAALHSDHEMHLEAGKGSDIAASVDNRQADHSEL